LDDYKNAEIILIDNNSDKETKETLKGFAASHKNVIIITNKQNLGFPKAINQGLKIAKGQYVFIANNDIILPPNWQNKMINQAEQDSRIGLVGPVTNSVSGVQKVNVISYSNEEEMYKFMKEISKEKNGQSFEFPRIAFLFTLIKREVIEKIGGLDERFTPGNYEDDDYCLRAQLAGFKTIIAADVFVHHYGSTSFTAEGEEKYNKILETNKRKFIDKWGATPDEIWLHGKKPKDNDLFIPVKEGFLEYINKAQIEIENENYSKAKTYLEKALKNFDPSAGIDKNTLQSLLDKITMAINT
jgi:GT2 family glycosyltransferase